MQCIFSYCLLILGIPALFAQSPVAVSGVIEVDTRWSGNVIVTGDVTVQSGVTLIIDPGTQVLISAKTDTERRGRQPDRIEITVLGALVAPGLHGEGQIVFTSAAPDPQMHDWYGIIFRSRHPASILKNVLIEYAYTGITCYGSSPQIENCTIQYNHFAGINCVVRARPLIRSSMILANGFAGVNAELAAAPIIENCIISQNAHGVVIYDQAHPDLGRRAAQPGQSAGGNHLSGNFDYNIYNRSQNDILAQYNYWNTSDVAEIRQTIFDRARDPEYGAVIIEPVLEAGLPVNFAAARRAQTNEPPSAPAPPRRLPASAEPTSGSPPLSSNTSLPAGSNSRSNTPTRQIESRPQRPPGTGQNEGTPALEPEVRNPANSKAPADTSAPVTETSSPTAASTGPKTAASGDPVGTPPPEAVAQTESPPNARRAVPEDRTNGPVIESFLDGGRRQYIRRQSPGYPRSYQKAGIQGTVLMEVTVGRDGRVRDYRVLRSDGEWFSEEAIKAIRNFRYKPGTVDGRPVSFKIIERFEFKLEDREN